jgi:amino-acid N-acetyltransferase
MKQTRGRVTLRPAKPSEARTLHALISANLQEGHLLPRTLPELSVHASRFVVATRARRIVGCAELAALSTHVAEVRSLAVDAGERGKGVGTMIVDELRRRARREGFEKLCAFTHAPAYFIQMGFSIVPHTWLLEKVTTDCVHCPLFRTCGQFAMIVPLESAYDVDRAAAISAAAVHRHA